MFITFEGTDYTGKSTQSSLLGDYLISMGYQVVLTAEPGFGEMGTAIRNFILHQQPKPNPSTEALMFAADRSNHYYNLIKPSLKAGKIVICDRYIDSSIVYQSYGKGLGEDAIKFLSAFGTESSQPDITFLLTTQTSLASRSNELPDNIEAEPEEIQQRIRDGYINLANQSPERIIQIPAQQDIQMVQQSIINAIQPKLQEFSPRLAKTNGQTSQTTVLC
jgi:dTMP kinase